MKIIMDACALMAIIIKQLNNDKKEKSSIRDIPFITADITTQEIVNIIRENRAGI